VKQATGGEEAQESSADLGGRGRDIAVKLEEFLSVLLLLSVFVLVFGQVIARFVFSSPFFWAGELARYSYVWLTFVAAIAVTARGLHITVKVGDKVLGQRGRFGLALAAHLFVVVSCCIILLGGFTWMLDNAEVRSAALQLPLGFLYGVVYLSFAGIALHTLGKIVGLLRAGSARAQLTDEPNISETGEGSML
jgi:TRAP-type C4-dicarboxylate transport system permease small subunit